MRKMRSRLLGGIKFCQYCGARILFQGYNEFNRFAHIMQRKTICYDCAYWLDLREYPPSHLEVLGNRCFKIYPEVNQTDKADKTTILGGKGKLRYFMRADRTVFKSNDVWLIGTVPERFRADFPPTAVEITSRVFNSLNLNRKLCKARACMDRYHCFRFNMALEQDGAYNRVPPKWHVGDEHCRSFINLDTMYIDENSITNKRKPL